MKSTIKAKFLKEEVSTKVITDSFVVIIELVRFIDPTGYMLGIKLNRTDNRRFQKIY